MGLIPAHAGKTRSWRSPQPRRRAHPRSRGENQIQVLKAHLGDGSSPLTRGKHPGARARPHPWGLIPAHAGKTQKVKTIMKLYTAHPRSRGENKRAELFDRALDGSSPLTRGKQLVNGERRYKPGLIPAHAGKTYPPPPVTPPSRAHPRSRGENVDEAVGFGPGAGSSPLTRGKHAEATVRLLNARLIPAHAGKTLRIRPATCTSRAHPRSRGENHRIGVQHGGEWGSSPLTRGKRLNRSDHAGDAGLIPAHAGKTVG